MKYIVDRIEGNIAVCEDENGNMVDILLSNFEEDAHEKDVVEYVGNSYKLLKKETRERKKYIENLAKDIWKN